MRRRDFPLATNVQRRYISTKWQQSAYHDNTLKDCANASPEEFDPDRMECINIGDMISNSPFEKKIVDGYERSVLKEQTEDSEAIVKVVAFPGLVVHRQGGGALAKRLLKEEQEADDNQSARLPPDVQRARRMAKGDKLTGDEGFRTRVLCKSVVHLIWGRQRLLTREVGTSAHIDAMRDGKEKKYEDDRKGYIELYDYFLQKNPGAAR